MLKVAALDCQFLYIFSFFHECLNFDKMKFSEYDISNAPVVVLSAAVTEEGTNSVFKVTS